MFYFYNSTAVAAAAVGGGSAELNLRVAYIVRTLYFNFQPTRTILLCLPPEQPIPLIYPPPPTLHITIVKHIKIIMINSGKQDKKI